MHGIDLSEAYIKHARRHLRRRPRVATLVAKAESLPLPDTSQDAVTSIFMMHELPPHIRREMIGECARVLKPGGLLILTATVLQWTGQSPAMDIMERARIWENNEPGAYVSVFYGFPWSDVPDIGAQVHVMTNDDQALADRIARDMAEFIWRQREEFAAAEFPQQREVLHVPRAHLQDVDVALH